MSKEDFKYIRWSLALALAMIVAGVSLVLWSQKMLHAEQSAHRAALAKRVEVGSRLTRARAEEQDIRQSIERLNALRAGGIVGGEQRLEWVEHMRRIKVARKLYDLQYEIAPQHVLDPAILPGTSGDFEFLASTMRLQMQLLHEGDLLGFLGDLRGSGYAYLRPRSCVVERLARIESERVPEPVGAGPQLKADCVIDWITVRERGGRSQTGQS